MVTKVQPPFLFPYNESSKEKWQESTYQKMERIEIK